MGLTGKVDIIRYENGSFSRMEDLVAKEYALTLYLNGDELVTLLCSPSALSFLAVGFLASEGLITKQEEILSLKLDEQRGTVEIETSNKDSLARRLYGKRMVTTGCGKGTSFYVAVDALKCSRVNPEMKLAADDIIQLMKSFSKMSGVFAETGGVHSACLCKDREVVLFYEDIGRHNALDKIIGEALYKGVDTEDKLLITSGRLSSEILIKCAKRRIPVVVSRSAPTEQAVVLGRQLGIGMIGFVRGLRFNVYSEIDIT